MGEVLSHIWGITLCRHTGVRKEEGTAPRTYDESTYRPSVYSTYARHLGHARRGIHLTTGHRRELLMHVGYTAAA